MRASRASALIGYPVSRTDAAEVFDRLQMAHEAVDEDALRVEVPGYRVDLEREVDLIEEVVRVQGYERVGSTLPPVRQTGGLPQRYAFVGRVRDGLVRAGLREVRQIPFVSDEDLALTGERDAVAVTNPLQADEGWMRPRLLPGLLDAARRNAFRHVGSIAIFEADTVFRLEAGSPRETPAAAFVLNGAADTGWTGSGRAYDVFDAKGVVEALLSELGIAAWTARADAGAPFHPGRSAVVEASGRTVGAFGELHPRVAASFDLPGRVAAGELDLEVLMGLASDLREVGDVPRFPPVRRDLAFVVDAAVPAAAVRSALEEAAGELLDACLLFDVHVGPPLPEGTKSLAYSIDFRAPDRTLTDAEVAGVVGSIADRLAREVGAQLRAG
jgi:phenylalanyl-tRNA synthetase beta chain